MKLSCVVILFSVFIICANANCTSEFKEFNFLTKEQPDTVINIEEECVKIVRLTQNNLDRFTNLKEFIGIINFKVDNINILNQPRLFAHHPSLKEVQFITYNGIEELLVHEELFQGLENLENIAIAGLNLETIPNRIFYNLPNLQVINLANNKLKTLPLDVFGSNPKLSNIFLGENQFLQFGFPLDLILLNQSVGLSLSSSDVPDFYSLLPIFSHPNITYTNLGSCNLTNIKLSDFAQFPERQNKMDIRAYDAEYEFFVDDLQQNEINYEIISNDQLQKIVTESRAYFKIVLTSDSPLCNDCRFIKYAFKSYLTSKDDFNVHLIDSKVVFPFFFSCDDMENHYTQEFKTNCPDECTCQYNQFLNKVWVNCNRKNLTNVPAISYPTQFDTRKISSFAIDLSDNLIESFSLENIDGRVAKDITELILNGNQLKSINLGEAAAAKLYQFDLCNNPIFNENFNKISLSVENVLHDVTNKECSVGHKFPTKPLLYINQKGKKVLEQILENVVCN